MINQEATCHTGKEFSWAGKIQKSGFHLPLNKELIGQVKRINQDATCHTVKEFS